MPEVHDFLETHARDLREQLTEWVRIPSVSGDPACAQHVTRSANWLAARFRESGFPVVELLPTGDTLSVYAEWCEAPGAATVLVYSHHDVRAAKDVTWVKSSPYEPQFREGRLYGRGSSDAKGQVIAHVWGVLAHLAAGAREAPAINLKFYIDGEEETGSAHMKKILEEQRERFACDLIVFSDTPLWRADAPAVSTSMRGTWTAHLEVRGAKKDVHSGATSGPTPNAIHELARVLGRLHDADGRVAIPGFYDEVQDPSAERRAEVAALPYSDEDWLDRSETNRISGERGYSVLERLWLRPTVEVINIAGGDPVEVNRSTIPATASADLSIRTVPDQSVDTVTRLVREWLDQTLSDTVTYELSVPPTAQEAYVSRDADAVAALARAMGRGWRTDAVGRMGSAGGGPADLLDTILGAPVVFFGTGLPEDHWHEGDESVRLDVLLAGAATLAFLWEDLARSDGAESPSVE